MESYRICIALKNAFSSADRKERKEGGSKNKSALTPLNLKQCFAASFSNTCLLKLSPSIQLKNSPLD